MVPTARDRVHAERIDLKHERARTKEFNRLSTVVSKLGPANILACGQPKMPILVFESSKTTRNAHGDPVSGSVSPPRHGRRNVLRADGTAAGEGRFRG